MGRRGPYRGFYSFGIDTMEKRIQAHLCRFVGNNINVIWKRYLREDGMGINYDEIEYKFQDPDKCGRTWGKYL